MSKLIREELIRLINGWTPPRSTIDDDSSLISSGLLDSLALFQLIEWIEQKTGRTINAASVDIVREWDSVARILSYVENSAPTPHSCAPAAGLPQSDYRIVRYTSALKDDVANFQTGLWSPDPALNRQYLEWKYEHNPYANAGRIYLAFYKDVLVGMRGFYGSMWEAGTPTRRTPVLIADDLLIKEDHRNRGVVTQIMQAAFDDLLDSASPFTFNLSGSTLTILNSLAMGWKSIGPLYLLHRRSRHFFHAIKRLLSRTSASVEPRPDAMARLVQRIGHDGRVRHVRDERYFEWRFQNPFREYQFLYAGDAELDGYLVLKRSIRCYEPSQQMSIADLEAVNAKVRVELLRAAAAACAFSQLTTWTSSADNQTLAAMRGLGFERVDAMPSAVGPTFLVRPIQPDLPETEWCLDGLKLLEQRNWDIRMLYSMSG